MYGRRYTKRTSAKLRLVPIDSTKHYVQINTQIATATVGFVNVAQAVKPANIDESDITKVINVEENCMIKGFNIGLRVFQEEGVADSGSVVIILRKWDGGAVPALPTLAAMNSLSTQTWKARIFHAEQAIAGSQVSGIPMGFPSVKIPKRFHVMRNGDLWSIYVANNTGNNVRICGLIEYKSYV